MRVKTIGINSIRISIIYGMISSFYKPTHTLIPVAFYCIGLYADVPASDWPVRVKTVKKRLTAAGCMYYNGHKAAAVRCAATRRDLLNRNAAAPFAEK